MLLDPAILGELIRHLQEWQSLYEAEGTDTLTGPGGDVYCLADLLRLHELSRHLPPLQAMAIQCLYLDKTDADAARLMRTAAGYGVTARVTLRALSKRTARLLYMDPIRAGEEFSLTLFRREGGEVALRCVVTHCDRDGGDAGAYAIEARFVRLLSDTGPALPAHEAAEIERIRMAVFG